jgi:WS/DGAT/MGAT family acyltransferase
MRRLSPLDAQFLNVESPTTVAHVGSLILVDPSTAPRGRWDLETVRSVLEPRLHLAPALRQRLAELPLGLGRPYWVEEPGFDIEFHLRELALPAPGSREQLAEQVARIHARPLDRSRPLWEGYVITGLEGGKAAYYSKIHHAAIDGVSGAEILETILDITPEPREIASGASEQAPQRPPSRLALLGRGITGLAIDPLEALRTAPRSLAYVDEVPGATNFPGVHLLSDAAGLVLRLLGGADDSLDHRGLRAPRTPFNGQITAHRRFSFGSVPLAEVKRVKDHFGMTVNDVVLALAAGALRRWLLDHDALPGVPLVVAVPVSVRGPDRPGEAGNQVSVMMAELPTQLADPRERLLATQASMSEAKRHFETVPISVLEDLSALIPAALSGSAARALFRLATVRGVLFNLFVSNVPGPQVPLYVAGAKVEGLFPVSAVSDMSGGLNITLFSYNGSLDFGLVACREMVPDIWSLMTYIQDAMAELVALLPGEHAAGQAAGGRRTAKPRAGRSTARGR